MLLQSIRRWDQTVTTGKCQVAAEKYLVTVLNNAPKFKVMHVLWNVTICIHYCKALLQHTLLTVGVLERVWWARSCPLC